MQPIDTPLVTVVVPTRNRSDRIVNTIHSILLTDYPRFELRIIDQSDNDSTKDSLRFLLDNPRICYTRTASEGISAGLNLGISQSRSEYIAITGDDCDVKDNWLKALVEAFAVDRRIGIVFGNTMPGGHDHSEGFVPAYVRDRDVVARSIYEKHLIGGTSACMGVRRSIWEELDGFDEMLGVGAALKAGEDADLATRALLRGYFIYETPCLTVTHHGFYRWTEHRLVTRRYWYGTGAALGKHLQCGHWAIVAVLWRLAWNWMVGSSGVAASMGNRSHRLLRLAAFIQGFAVGAITSVDRSTGHYRIRQKKSESFPACRRLS